jgi:SAM-dependent methyltransferase
MLRRRSPGPRLLDVGFGRGYLLQMAQVHGFEIHGVDSSAVQAAELAPQFGDRVAARVVGRDPIPWTDMDVVVMSHVLEHLPDPAATLDEVRSVLVPGGWLYLAVPDMGSMDFRIFGKTWDVISPLVHLQYFTEASLESLLERCGFEAVERVRHPRIRDEISPRWMRLMRRLGGDELGELAYVARVPGVLT